MTKYSVVYITQTVEKHLLRIWPIGDLMFDLWIGLALEESPDGKP